MIPAEVCDIFERIVTLPRPDREAALGSVHTSTADEVRSLLQAFDMSPAFLQKPVPRFQCGLDETVGYPDPEAVAENWIRPGTRLGAYIVVREVGRGGMGVVYEALQDEPQRRVALKVMKSGAWSHDHRARFRREAYILGRLGHPNVATVFEARTVRVDLTDTEPIPVFAMEFIDGMPITDHARAEGFGPKDCVRLLIEACRGVQHAHGHGIVHRDISPSNILVDRSGGVKVIDFGIARLADIGKPAAITLSQGHNVLGKWPYMAPEQALGEGGAQDHRVDVFGLGAVLYELLTGRTWLDVGGRTAFEMLRAIERDPVPRPALRECARRQDLVAVIVTALSKNPAHRYQSAGELCDDLERWLCGRPVVAREPPITERAREFVRQHRVLSASVGTAFLALSVGFIGVTVQAARATRAEHAATATLNGVLKGIVSTLQQSRAALHVRASVLERVRPQVEQLMRSTGDDPDVRLSAASYFTESAQVVGYPYTPNLGRFEESLELLNRSIQIAAPQGVLAQLNEELAFAAVSSISLRAAALYTVQRSNEMLSDLDQADRACSGWLARTHDQERWFVAQAKMWTLRVQAMLLAGLSEDIPSLLRGCQEAAASTDRSGAVPAVIGAVWQSLARAAREATDHSLALDATRRAREAYARADQIDGLLLQWTGDTYRYDGMTLRELGKLAESDAAFTHALDLFERSEAALSNRADVLGVRAIALGDRAMVRSTLKDPRAVSDARQSLAIRRERLAEEPDVPGSRERLVEALERLATVIGGCLLDKASENDLDRIALESERKRCLEEAAQVKASSSPITEP